MMVISPEWNLEGQRALVTGASSGLGQAMSEALLTAGAEVVVTARSASRLERLCDTWRSDGLKVHHIVMDVTNPESVENASRWVNENLRGLDIIVNNAGIGMNTVNINFSTQPKPFFEVPLDKFRDLISTNLTGYFLVASRFAPIFLKQKSGRFVNVSVNRQTMVRKGFVPYGPSRAASEALSYIMTEDLRQFGITVNILLPGGITLTRMVPEHERGRADLLNPKIMGPPIVFLASKEAEGLTGQRLVGTEFDDWLYHFRASRQQEWFL